MFSSVFADFPVSVTQKKLYLPNIRKDRGETLYRVWEILQSKESPAIEYQDFRKAALPCELNKSALDVYLNIVDTLPTDADVLRISAMVASGPLGKAMSGRTIDTLMTKYAEIRNVFYMLDVGCNPFRLADENTTQALMFDIGESYREHMRMYSKNFFDCFGRGQLVLHTLSSGTKIVISLCKFMFYIWADRYLVFEFLRRNVDDIVRVRKMSQQQSYQPKKKRVPVVTAEEREAVLRSTRSRTLVCPRAAPPTWYQRQFVVLRPSRTTNRFTPYKYRPRPLFSKDDGLV